MPFVITYSREDSCRIEPDSCLRPRSHHHLFVRSSDHPTTSPVRKRSHFVSVLRGCVAAVVPRGSTRVQNRGWGGKHCYSDVSNPQSGGLQVYRVECRRRCDNLSSKSIRSLCASFSFRRRCSQGVRDSHQHGFHHQNCTSVRR